MDFQNPVIKGFHPDPSICRVGEDYYLAVSSFEYFPGIPLFHSKDLINWEQLGCCISRNDQLDFAFTKDSGGIWAPTIRYWEGTFYVTATFDVRGNFIVSAKDIHGPWSDPVWVDHGGIDPSLFFEGSKAYYCTNFSLTPGREEITLSEVDAATGQRLGEIRTIWEGTGGGFLESPHIYHIGKWYYLMAAEGGTSFNHMITIARSEQIDGPYESCPNNPILTNRTDTSKEVLCTGHGDLLEDHNGNWWMFHLGIRTGHKTMSHLGRETFLTPVEWKDEWPWIGNHKRARIHESGPLWAEQKRKTEWTDEFADEDWKHGWIFIRNPKEAFYERRNGTLILHPSTQTFAGICQPDFECSVETCLRFSPDAKGDEAGILLRLASDFHYRIGKRKEDDGEYLVVDKTAGDFRQTAYREKIQEGPVYLKVIADKENYHFFYGIEETSLLEVCSASTKFLSCELAGKCFTGTIAGLYAWAKEETEAEAEFSYMRLRF